MAVSDHLVFTRADGLDPVDLHQPADPALTDIEAGFLQLHRHARATIAAKAQAILLPDVGHHL